MVKNRQRAQDKPAFRISKRGAITIGIAAAVAISLAILGYYSMIPANRAAPVLGIPSTHLIKASHSSSTGYVYINKGSASAKGQVDRTLGGIPNPSYFFKKDSLENFDLINSDYYTHSKHNLNIDEFNVHTRDLGYFETQAITFVADKTGTFEYYCTLHPEMRGNITVE